MSQVDFHSLNATQRRSAGVLPLKTAAISSLTISRSLSSICMGAGPIFAQDLKAVNLQGAEIIMFLWMRLDIREIQCP